MEARYHQFLLGARASLLASWPGMSSTVRANARVAEGARDSTASAFWVAFLGGSMMELAITSCSLLIPSLLYSLSGDASALVGLGCGASLAALFAQMGGGIYARSADVGVDVVRKVEQGIPEDDPRNPTVIADHARDNVGDGAGRGADLFQSFRSDVVTELIMGATLIPRHGVRAPFYPLVLQDPGIVSSMAAILAVVRHSKSSAPTRLFSTGILSNTVVNCCGAHFVALWMNDLSIFVTICAGIMMMMLLASFTTRYYVGKDGLRVRRIGEASHRGLPSTSLVVSPMGFEVLCLPSWG
jgi:K(+)-stimulated pyrophosphate-energized sodium pump